MMNCGSPIAGRPSLGSWLAYGLGSENRDLPAFVSLVTVVTVLLYRSAAAAGWSPEVASVWAIGGGIGVGGLCGLGNGVLVTWLRIVPFVATLGMMGAARGVAQSLSGGNPVTFPDALELTPAS